MCLLIFLITRVFIESTVIHFMCFVFFNQVMQFDFALLGIGSRSRSGNETLMLLLLIIIFSSFSGCPNCTVFFIFRVNRRIFFFKKILLLVFFF